MALKQLWYKNAQEKTPCKSQLYNDIQNNINVYKTSNVLAEFNSIWFNKYLIYNQMFYNLNKLKKKRIVNLL